MAVPTDSDAGVRIDPGTAIGKVSLTVNDLPRSQQFYEQLLGLRALPGSREQETWLFADAGGDVVLQLRGDPLAPARNPRQTGLFHLAVLYPTRRDLAVALARLGSARWPLSGASDHVVSEALYLTDPDGNGIELYADRDRSSWPLTPNGEVEMDTLPLDLDDLLSELDRRPPDPSGGDLQAPAGTRIGHVHLQVAELGPVEQFYVGVLGLDVTARWRGQALFVSAGGYHHHIGMNTWNSRGGSAPVNGGVGLVSFDLVVPGEQAFDDVVARIDQAGINRQDTDIGGVRVSDPSGNGVVLRPTL